MPITGLPTSDYSQQALDDAKSSNPNTALTGDIAAGQAVNIAGTNMTIDSLLAQIGLVNPELQQGQAEAQLQGTDQLAQGALSQEQLGLQGQGLQAQAGLLGTQYGIQQQTLAGQEQLAGTQYGISEQQIGAEAAAQAQSYGNQVENTAGGLAAQGAGNTQGAKQAISTGAFQNTQAQQAIGLQQAGTQAQYGFQQQQFGLEQQGQAAQQQYSLGNIARGEAGLGLSAQANDLSTQQMVNQINYGMQQQGIQGQLSADQLYGQLGQAQAQGATYTAGALGVSGLLGNVNLNQALSGINQTANSMEQG